MKRTPEQEMVLTEAIAMCGFALMLASVIGKLIIAIVEGGA